MCVSLDVLLVKTAFLEFELISTKVTRPAVKCNFHMVHNEILGMFNKNVLSSSV